MCSQQDDLIPSLEELDLNVKLSNTCKRCESKADVVLRKKDPLCKACFNHYVTHKFRATLGKAKIMKPQDRVLICFSGGQASAAMLNFVTQGQQEIARKKVTLEPIILHIAEPSFNVENSNAEHTEKVVDLMKSSDYPSYLVNLEQFTNESFDKDDIHQIQKDAQFTHDAQDQTSRSKLQDLITNTKTLSAQEDLLHHLKMKLLAKCAVYLNCSKVFIGDTATKLAIRIVSGLAIGRGGQMPYVMGFVDNRHEDVTFIRPMREIISKEVVYYNLMHNISSVSHAELSTKTSLHSSIQRLTEGFINGLQEDFPATISTVFRTGDKLNANSLGGSKVCFLCRSAIEETDASKCTAIDSLEFSANLGELYYKDKKCSDDNPNSSCDSCSCQNSNTSLDMNRFKSNLCYACKLIINDIPDVKHIPASMINEATQQLNRSKMKDMIAEYLIQDDDNS